MQEAQKDLLFQSRLLLVDRVDQTGDSLVRLFLVRLESLRYRDGRGGEDFLDFGLGRGVLFAVVVLSDGVSLSNPIRLAPAGSVKL